MLITKIQISKSFTLGVANGASSKFRKIKIDAEAILESGDKYEEAYQKLSDEVEKSLKYEKDIFVSKGKIELKTQSQSKKSKSVRTQLKK